MNLLENRSKKIHGPVKPGDGASLVLDLHGAAYQVRVDIVGVHPDQITGTVYAVFDARGAEVHPAELDQLKGNRLQFAPNRIFQVFSR